MTSVMGQFLEFKSRKSFYMKHRLALEQARSFSILKQVLPISVAKQLKKGKRFAKEHKFEHATRGVSVLFIQIFDFEEETSDFAPDEIVGFLNRLFSHFDDLTTIHDVFKVETVGEVYMVACGCPEKAMTDTDKPDHARRLADFAVNVMYHSDGPLTFVRNDGTVMHFKIRIGCNTGTVIAGVIGQKLPRYRLIGDTVNVASRMESTAKVGTIQCTQRFKDLLPPNDYKIRPRQKVLVKGKGLMDVWIIESGLTPRHKRTSQLKADNKELNTLSFLQNGRKIVAKNKGLAKLRSKYRSDFLSIKRESQFLQGITEPFSLKEKESYLNSKIDVPPPPKITTDSREESLSIVNTFFE